MTEGSVSSLAFSPDDKTLAAGYVYMHHQYFDRGVLLWDVAGRKRVIQAPLPVREGRVESMAFSPDGKTLAVGYTLADNTPGGVVLWDVAGRKRVVEKPLAVTEGRLSSLAFSPDGNSLATSYTRLRGTPGGGVVLWDVAGRKRLIQATLPETRGQVARVAFAPDGKTLAAAYVRASLVLYNEAARQTVISVMLWDVAEHKLVVEESPPVNDGKVGELVVSPDCKTLAAGYSLVRGLTWDNGVLLWNVGGRPGGN